MNAGRQPAVAALRDYRNPFAAVGEATVNVLAACHAASVHEEFTAVTECVFHGIRIEILVYVSDAFRTHLIMPAAESLGLDRPVILHPALMVDDVNVKVAEASAAGPDKAVKSLYLIKKVADTGRFGQRAEEPYWSGHPVASLQNYIADFAVLDAFSQLFESPAVTGHQPYANLEVLGLGLFGKLKHPPAGWAVNCDRLFHKDVKAFLYRVGEMYPAKSRRRCEDCDIARAQAIHRVLVSIEANELAVLRHIHLIGKIFLQVIITAFKAILEYVGHSNELDWTLFDGQSVFRRPGAPAAAADQDHINSIVLPGVNSWRYSGKSRGRGD